jgi:SAM-dependent methyltransferase
MRNPELYDSMMEVRGRSWDVLWYQSLVNSVCGPVLELGVGTGRILLPFLEAGIDIYGIELDNNMLTQARAKIAQSLGQSATKRVMQEDMRCFSIPICFASVLAPYNVLPSIHGETELNQMLACVERHLQPNGFFAFDMIVAESLPWSQPPYSWSSEEKIVIKDTKVLFCEKGTYDPYQRLHQIEQLFLYPDGRQHEEQLLLYQWDVSNLEQLLEAQGWKHLNPPSNFKGEAFRNGDVVYAAQLMRNVEK